MVPSRDPIFTHRMNSAIWTEDQEINVSSYFAVVFSALIFYDYSLRLDDEINLIWATNTTAVSLIYYANRYLSLLYGVALLIQVLNWDTTLFCSCVLSERFFYVINIMLFVTTATFSALRVFAISARNWYIAVTTLLLGLFPVVFNIYTTIRQSLDTVVWLGSYPACFSTPYYSEKANEYFIYGTYMTMISSEICVIVTTWYHTYHAWRMQQQATPLASLLLKDGTIYFISLVGLAILELVIQLAWDQGISLDGSYTSYFIAPIAPLLISRFILNLRQIPAYIRYGSQSQPDSSQTGSQTAGISELDFGGGVMGNLGAPVDHELCSLSAFAFEDEPSTYVSELDVELEEGAHDNP